MTHYLMKTEPDVYGWHDMLQDGVTEWDGVNNPAALQALRAMVPGDQAFFYHTGDERRIMGVVEILRAALPDPKDAKGKMVLVRVKPIAQLHQPVTLAAIKQDDFFKDFALVRQSRLSVMVVPPLFLARILDMSGGLSQIKA
ncbi:MAG: EVE domain-containing protein [Alphaproteobacteria bacterium]|nr:EVE domain-containing protein [Alphaproteobacteria bacterium]